MSWINEIEEEQAEDELSEIYEDIKRKRGKLSNIMKIQSLNPEAMKSHLDLYLSIMFKDRCISREMCEMIGVIVSSHNGCRYCVNHHAEALSHFWKDDKRVQELAKDFENLDLSEEERALAAYVSELTENPDNISETDVQKLKDAGFTDEQVLNINMICSYFNFVNRIALGLGVDFSEDEMKGYDYQ
ncbi:MAG: peroxidase-related enzyme [Candidatus Thermoplasmatota archaeon]|nr:peroxidase-related enzyme [Candidatus Thermoplasmatota archaeon]